MTPELLEAAMKKLTQIGVVVEADYNKARVRVQFDGLKSAWLRWGVQRAGGDVSWWAPEVGEQVLVMFPYGDESQGVIITTLYSDAVPAPDLSPDKHLVKYQDGTTVEYDRATHHMKVNCVGSIEINGATQLSVNFDGSITVTAPNTTINTTQTHNGDVSINGDLNVSGMTTTGGLVSQGTVGGGATITGSVDVSGGDVVADGISLKGHTHPGDSGGTTGTPQ